MDGTNNTTGLAVTWERDAVEMAAWERGRRFVDRRVECSYANLWGWLLPGRWRYIHVRHVMKSRAKQRTLLYDRFPGLASGGLFVIPWFHAGGPNTTYFENSSGQLIERSRVFSRLLVRITLTLTLTLALTLSRVFSRLLVRVLVRHHPRPCSPRSCPLSAASSRRTVRPFWDMQHACVLTVAAMWLLMWWRRRMRARFCRFEILKDVGARRKL